MPEKYQLPQEQEGRQSDHPVIGPKEPEQKSPVLNQETGESFDQKKYDRLIEHITELGEILFNIDRSVPPDDMHDAEIYINWIVRNIDIAEQALLREESRQSAMIWLRQLIDQAQDNQKMFHLLQKTYVCARAILGRNLDVMEASIKEDPGKFGDTALRALIAVRNYGLSDQRISSVRILHDHVLLADTFLNTKFLEHADLLELVFSYGNIDDRDRWHEKINGFFQGSEYNQFLGREAIVNLFRSHDSPARGHGNAIIMRELERHGIYGKEAVSTIAAWKKSDEHKRVPRAIAENVGTIAELEEKQPGCVERLSHEFGIKDFARYPMELLLTQDTNRENTDTPYGIIMYDRQDHNGALYQTSGALRELYQSTRGGYQLRVMEYEGKPNFGRKLIEIRKRYGDAHKISFAIIAAHGGQYAIQNLLSTRELEKQRIQRVTDFFEEDPTIILVSCSTGKEYGIGQGLSETLGMHIIAPNKPTNINSIHTEIKEGKIQFSVTYSAADAQEYIRGKKDASPSKEAAKDSDQ